MNPKEEAKKLIKKYATNNPFELADCLKVVIIKRPLGNLKGCYKLIKRNKVIFINSNLPYLEQRNVCGHELAHCVMHPYVNCKFIQNYTLFSTDKIEIEANKFCAHLLLPDYLLLEFESLTYEQIATATGIPIEIVKLRR